MHRTVGWHFAISLSCCGGVTWLPRPLFLSLVSGQHNSNTTIAMKLPVKASFLEIAIAIMVLNHSVFIWGDSPWFELSLHGLCCWGVDWFPAGAADFSVLLNVCRVTVVVIPDAHGKAADPCSWQLSSYVEWSSSSTFPYVSSVHSDTCSLTSCNQPLFCRKNICYNRICVKVV